MRRFLLVTVLLILLTVGGFVYWRFFHPFGEGVKAGDIGRRGVGGGEGRQVAEGARGGGGRGGEHVWDNRDHCARDTPTDEGRGRG
jgi:hypothetical protein